MIRHSPHKLEKRRGCVEDLQHMRPVAKLRNLVKSHGSHEASNTRDPRIVIRSPSGTGIGLRTDRHRPELEAVENSAVSSHPSLLIKNGTRRSELNCERDQWKQRKRKQQAYARFQ